MSDPERRSSSLATWLLAGSVLLIAVVAGAVPFVPLVSCPECKGTGEDPWDSCFSGRVPSCRWCEARGRLTVSERLTLEGRREAAYKEFMEVWERMAKRKRLREESSAHPQAK